MSVAKVIEIKATSKKSFEDAIQAGVDEACKSLKNVRSAWVAEQDVEIKDGKIESYRVLMRVTFVLD